MHSTNIHSNEKKEVYDVRLLHKSVEIYALCGTSGFTCNIHA